MQNPENGSVSRLITDLKNGDHEAARQIWQLYFENIVRLARKRLREVPRAMADEEDAALSILNSFFVEQRLADFQFLPAPDRGFGIMVSRKYRLENHCSFGHRLFCIIIQLLRAK
jgi:hypothetical protein